MNADLTAHTGLGIDIVDIDRFEKVINRSPGLIKKLFSNQEIKYCNSKQRPAVHFAARFAAKEAVCKALGTAFFQGVGYRDIEVVLSKNGRPEVNLSPAALKIAEAKGVIDLPISISHTHIEAVCCALAISDASTHKSMESESTTDELVKQFKNLRGELDYL